MRDSLVRAQRPPGVMPLIVAVMAMVAPYGGVATAASPIPPTSPALSPALPLRPTLTASLAPPAGVPGSLDASGAPDAQTVQDGLEFEIWLPDEAPPTGGWAAAAVRATNVGDGPLFFYRDGKDVSCAPLTTRLELAGLFPSASATPDEGNRTAFAERFLTSGPFSLPMISQRDDGAYPCADNFVVGALRPGRSLSAEVTVPLIYPWRSQPLPGGTAEVQASLEFWRKDKAGREKQPVLVTTAAPLQVVGDPVEYVGPPAFLDRLLADTAFTQWLDTRDLGDDWNINLVGPDFPDGAAFSGGPAPFDTFALEVSAEGPGEGGLAQRWFDAWTADELPGPVR